MKRLMLTSLVLSIAMALVTACAVPTDLQPPVRPESELYILTVEIEPSEGGHVRHSGGGGEGQFRFESGEVVQFMAVPAEGYEFDYWSGDFSGENDTSRLVMDGDKVVAAHFSAIETVPDTYALRVEADPPVGGYVRHSGGGGEGQFRFESGEVVQFMAVPAEGYEFDYWNGDLSGESDTSRLVMDGNKWVVAHFSPVEAIPGTYALRVEADPPEGGYVRPTSGVYESSEVVTVMAVAVEGYEFNYWSGDLSGESDTSRLVMDGNKWVVAHFSPVEVRPETYVLTVEVDPPEGGYVRPAGGEYDSGEVVTIMAVAAEGYEFDYWSGHLSGESDTSRLVMDGNKWVVAHFKRSEVRSE